MREAMTTAIPPAGSEDEIRVVRERRALGAAGCVMLGKKAAALRPELVALLEARKLDRDEVVAASAALALLGDKELLPTLFKVRRKVRNHAAMKKAVTEAMKKIRKTVAKTAVREWTDVTGSFRIRAQLVSVKEGVVYLKKQSDGKVVPVPLEKLCKADRRFISN